MTILYFLFKSMSYYSKKEVRKILKKEKLKKLLNITNEEIELKLDELNEIEINKPFYIRKGNTNGELTAGLFIIFFIIIGSFIYSIKLLINKIF